ncbi:small subunit ribosomal protein S1 [Ardenticatena maritima]|uniref:Small subunit ribosomal protein S1 n=1 Tax=Ardenticatena maritima TaxID=872965 RepID=A0A0M8KAN0_9CHLR|nr:S1 RNA-binding domain-containing protein [Ardenticatena maritima]GAP64152.1 small subunit ribosomal protein S1 [Ardenticatena maritima]
MSEHIEPQAPEVVETPTETTEERPTAEVEETTVAEAETPESTSEPTSDQEATSEKPKKRRRRRKPRKQQREITVHMDELTPGMELKGIVRSTQDYGAFVDIGAETDGLVHISELKDGFVEKVEDVVSEGDEVTVWVKEIDLERKRISLTMIDPNAPRESQREADDGKLRLRDLEEGQEFTGIVTSIVDFGAFVDIGAETDGLVHISELSEERVNRVEDVVEVGQEVKVRIIGIDRKRKRISLSMREPREAIEYTFDDESDDQPVSLFALALARAQERAKKKRKKKQADEENPLDDIIRRTIEQMKADQ